MYANTITGAYDWCRGGIGHVNTCMPILLLVLMIAVAVGVIVTLRLRLALTASRHTNTDHLATHAACQKIPEISITNSCEYNAYKLSWEGTSQGCMPQVLGCVLTLLLWRLTVLDPMRCRYPSNPIPNPNPPHGARMLASSCKTCAINSFTFNSPGSGGTWSSCGNQAQQIGLTMLRLRGDHLERRSN